MRWLLGNFSDPQYRLSRAEQWEVTWHAHHHHLAPSRLGWTTFWLVAGSIVVFALAYAPLRDLLAKVVSPGIAPVLSGAIIIAGITVASAWAYRFIYTRPVRLAMRDLGHRVCLHCGYRLEGLPPRVECPECGRPDTGVVEPDRGSPSGEA